MEILKDKNLHFPCPQDKSKKCMHCSIQKNKENQCKKGCFRVTDSGPHPCLYQKNRSKISKKKFPTINTNTTIPKPEEPKPKPEEPKPKPEEPKPKPEEPKLNP